MAGWGRGVQNAALNEDDKADLLKKVACEQRLEAGEEVGGHVDVGLARDRMQVGEQLVTRSRQGAIAVLCRTGKEGHAL